MIYAQLSAGATNQTAAKLTETEREAKARA